MIITLPAPRLLPVTITTLSVLLAVKCFVLAQAVVMHGQRPVVVAAANAADAADGPKPAPGQPPPLSPPPLSPPPANPPKPPAAPAAPQATAPPVQGDAAPTVSDSEKAILQNLRQRRKELDAREAAVTARESMLTASEQKLSERVAELQGLQQKLEGLDAAQKQRVETGWLAMVKLFEAMKPKDAATIFNDLAMPVLVQVMDRMKDAKAAAVMAAMNPDKARELTAGLAEMRTGHDASSDQAAPDVKPGPAGG